MKLTIQHLNNKISVLEQDRYNIARQKDQTIEILNKELNRGVNINYLRNVVIKYLTSNNDSVIILNKNENIKILNLIFFKIR